jgi:hypothetical protein
MSIRGISVKIAATITFLTWIVFPFSIWLAGQITEPEDPPEVPIYPGAQQIHMAVLPKGPSSLRGQEASFVTTDEPDEVRGFYEQALQEDGWHSDYPCISFSIETRRAHYMAWINTLPSEKGQTHVKIVIYEVQLGCDVVPIEGHNNTLSVWATLKP